MITIDGCIGEGGGQVLRSSLTLSMLTGTAVKITNIRSKRSQPGLRPQHLMAVQAAAAVCDAAVEGAAPGAMALVFYPGEIRPGKYRFDIRTAGSTSLVLQTIFLPLAMAGAASNVNIYGGTHVPWSPCYDYLENQWLPWLEDIGFRALLTLHKAGFYPPGGGKVEINIRRIREGLQPLTLTTRGRFLRIRGKVGFANLDESIARRMKLHALSRVQPICRDSKIAIQRLEASSAGIFLMLQAEFDQGRCCATALGKKGKRAEIVADEAVDELITYLESDGAVDPYLADQLLLPLAIAGGTSILRTTCITRHLLTNAAVIEQFLAANIRIDGSENSPGTVEITPRLHAGKNPPLHG